MVNFGIIGCGMISGVHANAIRQLPNAQMVACCDIDQDIAARFAEVNHCQHYCDYHDMLTDSTIDVIIVATPHDLHAQMSIDALRAGKHVVCEKPMAIDNATAESVAKVATQHPDQVYTVCYQNRFNPSMVALKKMMVENHFGTLLGIKAIVTWHRDAGYYAVADWKGTLAHEGGGVLINQAIHTLDAICWLTQRPERIKGKIMTGLLDSYIGVEDSAMAVAELPSRVPVVIYATNNYVDDPDPCIELQFEKHHVMVNATQLIIDDVQTPLPQAEQSVGKVYWGAGHMRLLAAVLHRIMKVSDPLDDHLAGLSARDSLAMVEAIYRSDRTNAWEDI